jgi:hypothetical protein
MHYPEKKPCVLSELYSLPWYPRRTTSVRVAHGEEARAAMAMLTAKSRYLIDRARRAIALSHALVP